MAALAAAMEISGTPRVGETLRATSDGEGTWQWLRCVDEPCAVPDPIADETGPTYLLKPDDEGDRLRVSFTAPGAEAELSEPIGPIAPQPPPPNPSKIDSLTISGAPYVENQLNAVYVLSGGPPTLTSWQWSRCGSSCVPVGTAASYTVQPADVGSQLVVEMTVSNDDGGDSKTSGTGPVPTPPAITRGPTIFTAVEVGQMASAAASSRDGSEAWQWVLCRSADVDPTSCDTLEGANQDSYLVAAADAGSWLRARLTVTGNGPDAVRYSSAKFVSKPADPSPPRPPAPFTSTGTTPDTPTVVAPTLLDPFPIVRIKGRTTRVGARLTLLSVRAPRGTLIRVRCRSDYCPRSRLAINTRLHRLRVFERSLRAGVIIEIRVKHPKRIGKYTRFLIRRAAPPLRRDRCLRPGSNRPTRCPGA
jgi:hypothetical protein